MSVVTVYGTDKCPQTRHALAYLDDVGVRYTYFDIAHDRHALAWLRLKSGGQYRTPTVNVAGELLAAPPDTELGRAIDTLGQR